MLNNRIKTLVLIALLLLAACSPELASISPKQAAEMLASKEAIILDVREADEWQAQHIAGAIHIPLVQVQKRLSELQQYKHATVIVQCRSGKRSAIAVDTLKSAGFTQVYNLAGGIIEWAKDGHQTTQIKL